MKCKKKLLCLVMTAALILGFAVAGAAMASPALAATSTKVSVGKTYTISNYQYKVLSVKGKTGTASITGAKSKSITSVTVPDTVKTNGYTLTVTAIADNAFKGYTSLKTVKTNRALTKIGKNAFYGDSSLTKLDLSSSSKITDVGAGALKGIHAKAVVKTPLAKLSAYKKLLSGKGQQSTVSIETDHTHTYGPWKTTRAAACTVKGTQTATCSICGAKKTRTVAATGHKFGDWNVTTAATCTKNGVETRTCSNSKCTVKETRAIKATGHSYGEWKTTTAATCTKAGVETRSCTNSGCTAKETRTIKATGHNYGSWKVTTAATCTKAGITTQTCSNCGDTKSQSIAKTGHSFGSYTYNGDATCTKNGTETAKCTHSNCKETTTRTKANSAFGHKFGSWKTTTAATCTNPGVETHTCSNSGCTAKETRAVKATGHSYGSWKVTTAATCTKDGVETRSCTNSGCTAKETETIKAIGHSYGSWKVTTAATADKDGVETQTCSNCGDTKTKSIAKTGHTFGSYTYNNDATCTKDGTETAKCTQSGCTETTTRTKANTALGHTSVKSTTTPAACTVAGSITYAPCTRCGYTEPQIKIAAIGHSFTNYVYSNDATCETDGTETAVCDHDGCGETDTRTKAGTVLGHQLAEKVVKEANCIQAGAKVEECTREGCNYVSAPVTIPQTYKHRYGEYTIKKAATCTTFGSKEAVCAVCGDVYTVPIMATGHSYEAGWTVDTAPGCTTAGSQSRHCKNYDTCGGSIGTQPINPLGHDYGETQTEEATCTVAGEIYKACTREGCKEKQVLRVIAPIGHQFTNYKTISAATCTNGAVAIATCDHPDCDVTDEHITQPLGHRLKTINEKAASCTEPGVSKTYAVCTREGCDYATASAEAVTIPATGHTWGDVETINSRSIACSGKLYARKCTVCGSYDEEFFQSNGGGKGHNWDKEGFRCLDCGFTMPGTNGTDDHRLVWYVTYVTDPEKSEAFSNGQYQLSNSQMWDYWPDDFDSYHDGFPSGIGTPNTLGDPLDAIYNTANYSRISAPKAKAGYRFVGWRIANKTYEDGVYESENPDRKDNYKSMGMTFIAVYAADTEDAAAGKANDSSKPEPAAASQAETDTAPPQPDTAAEQEGSSAAVSSSVSPEAAVSSEAA